MPNIVTTKKYVKDNWALVLILSILIFLGVGVRFSLLEKHFSHIDDIGVAETIIDRHQYLDNFDDIYEEWRLETFNGDRGIMLQKISKSLESLSILKEVAYFGAWWRNFLHAIPNGWTYAPGQFYLTNFLVNSDQNYSEIKFFGRFPSFAFNIGAIGLLILFFVRLYKQKSGLNLAVVGTAILSFSWENIIYSVQMESYAVSTFAMLLIFLHLMHIIKHPIISNKKNFFRGMILAIPCLLQYQILVFIFPLYLALLLCLINKVGLVELLKSSLFVLLGFLSIFLVLIWPFLEGVTGNGITWNAGPQDEFILAPNWGGEIYSIFSEIANFFIINIPQVIESMLSPISFYSVESSFLGWLLSILSIIGLISFLSSKDLAKKVVGIFIFISIIFWITLLLFKVFAFSPTRHSMVLGAISIILIVESIALLEKFIKISWLKYDIGGLSITPFCFALSWIVLFLYTLSFAFENRIDPFSEVDIYDSMNDAAVDTIVVFDSTLQINLMPSVKAKYPILNANAWSKGEVPNLYNKGKDDNHLVGKKPLRVAIISSWGCFNLQSDLGLINDFILNRYNIYSKDTKMKMIEQICTNSSIGVEWSGRTSNGYNTFNYTVLEFLDISNNKLITKKYEKNIN